MSDISFSPSKPQEQGSGSSPLSLRTPTTWRYASTSEPPRSRRVSYGGSVTAEDDLSGDSFFSALEDPISPGTKRGDCDSDAQMLPSAPNYAANVQDSVSSIILNAERLRYDVRVVEDGERGVRRQRTEAQGDTVYDLAPIEILILANPSFTGLPEELILEIVFYLDLFDIMALRKTNRRLSLITRARVIWMIHLSSLLYQVDLPKNAATFLDSLLSTSALEHIVKRPHALIHKWFRSCNYQQNPSSSKDLSVVWSARKAFRLPNLLPGGRWLIAVCDDPRPLHAGVCLWDLDHGKLQGLPEAQLEVEGVISFIDIKMDKTGSFAFMAILSHKTNVAMTLVYSVEVYQIRFLPDSFGFFRIDSFPLNERRGFEVQIYPECGRVVVDLFDRVLIWDYSPANMCAWMVTSQIRHRFQRFSHRSAHAITCTYNFLLVADGDESCLRGFIFPLLLNRPKQLSALALYNIPPYFEHPLPQFSMSLRFCEDRILDISSILQVQESTLRQLALNSNVQSSGPTANPSQMSLNDAVDRFKRLRYLDPLARGVLFIDAAACSSYVFCSYPLHQISQHAGAPNALIWTSTNRGAVREQIHRGAPKKIPAFHAYADTYLSMTRSFNIPPPTTARIIDGPRGKGDALWVGNLDKISPSLSAGHHEPRDGVRTVVLMRSPDDPGRLVVLSALKPPSVDPMDFSMGQAVMDEVEQGEARTVFTRLEGENQGKLVGIPGQIEEASVDAISGRVCVVERIHASSITEPGSVLRLLEYA